MNVPNSVFVAGFIGGPQDELPDRRLADAFDCATLGIRPEHIDIVPRGTGMGRARWSMPRIWARTTSCFVDIGADEPVLVRQPGKLGTELGSRLTIPAARRASAPFRCQRRADPLNLFQPSLRGTIRSMK